MSLSMCVKGHRPSPDESCVVDGDTFWLKGEKMRLRDIDTPETMNNLCGGQREVALGKQASARLLAIMNGKALAIARDGKDRYGRTLVTLAVGGRDVGQMLVDERLARVWPVGPEWWCD